MTIRGNPVAVDLILAPVRTRPLASRASASFGYTTTTTTTTTIIIIIIAIITIIVRLRGCADKSLARPGRQQATATKLGICSTYSPRSSIHFLTRCSKFCKPLKKNSESCPSNQVSAAAMTSASDEKWRPLNCFFSPGNR